MNGIDLGPLGQFGFALAVGLWIARQVLDMVAKVRSGELLKNGDANRPSTKVLETIAANTSNLALMAVQVASIFRWVDPGADPTWREKHVHKDAAIMAAFEATHDRIDRLADRLGAPRRGSDMER